MIEYFVGGLGLLAGGLFIRYGLRGILRREIALGGLDHEEPLEEHFEGSAVFLGTVIAVLGLAAVVAGVAILATS